MKITFIGLGIMGSRMAANLLKNGVEVTVWNRSPEPVEPLLAQGAKTAKTVNAAVENADVVFSMLSNPAAVEAVFLEKDGALTAMSNNAIWVDCSTVNPSFTERAKRAADEQDIRFVDAPVAGTLPHAANAELVFFVGAEQPLLDEIEPYLNYMGKKVMRIGETGKGASFKMLVNVMLAQSMLIFSETVLLGEKMGLDKDFLLNVLPNLVVSA
ncbi:MAG: NAD(P)-dependent oxidoreductase, partial [Saprospiraceae bacterium]